MVIILGLIAFCTSLVGGMCGLGGGVIMKPTLDAMNVASVGVVNLLSSCTVFSMACYSIMKTLSKREGLIDLKKTTPLAVGAIIGGGFGSVLFSALAASLPDPEMAGQVQAAILGIVTLMTLCYTIKQDKINTKNIQKVSVIILVGIMLGASSSFLGIGGGPINLVVLHYFFSMQTKVAVGNSLFVILLSQAASIILSIQSGPWDEVNLIWILVMIIGGILGGAVGRIGMRIFDEIQIRNMFKGLMVVIVGICCYNVLS